MRVAVVSTDHGVPAYGSKGSSAHVQAVLDVLVRSGAEVHLVTARTGGAAPQHLSSVVVHELPRPSADDVAGRERAAAVTDAAVAAVLDRLHADAPLDLVHERYALRGRTATRWAAAHDVPSVLEVNAPLVDEQRQHRGLVDEVGAEAASREAFSTATAVVCVTAAVAAWVLRRTDRPERVHVVGNGVDTRRTTPRPGPVTPPDAEAFTTGFVGTLKPWHGVDVLLEATSLLVQRHPAHRLLVVGDGPGAAAVRDHVDRLGLAAHVEMTGAVAPHEVAGHLRRMDVAVAPYPPIADFYFSPLKVLEYLAAGVPVVASATGDLPQLLGDGELGVLVPPGDAGALADAVDALRLDPLCREVLRDRASRVARSRHDWTRVVGDYLAAAGVSLPGAAVVGG